MDRKEYPHNRHWEYYLLLKGGDVMTYFYLFSIIRRTEEGDTVPETWYTGNSTGDKDFLDTKRL